MDIIETASSYDNLGQCAARIGKKLTQSVSEYTYKAARRVAILVLGSTILAAGGRIELGLLGGLAQAGEWVFGLHVRHSFGGAIFTKSATSGGRSSEIVSQTRSRSISK